MVEILHSSMPSDIQENKALPGISPLRDRDWIAVDEAYSAQTDYRHSLLNNKRDLVLADQAEDAQSAINETFEQALQLMPQHGFGVTQRLISCPDGKKVNRYADSPLAVLGKCLQQDICILTKQGDEHILAAAVLCFPASWTLSEKIGRPLSAIHAPVSEYNANVARRVQRLFDGVRVGSPLRRNNYLRYENPDLFQPLSENDPVRKEPPSGNEAYLRAERQIIFRLPKTKAVVFSIHSYVVAAIS